MSLKACSRFLDIYSWVKKLRKSEHNNNMGGNWERKGVGGCNHFFKRLVPVYQLLVYLLVGQI